MKKATVTMTYYNDYKREWLTVPVWEAPEELLDPQATTADLRKMHADLQRQWDELCDFLDREGY